MSTNEFETNSKISNDKLEVSKIKIFIRNNSKSKNSTEKKREINFKFHLFFFWFIIFFCLQNFVVFDFSKK